MPAMSALHSRAADSISVSSTGLQIERRTADDLQHVGGGGLLLQRFAEIVGALAQFVEQPRVLDGDHGLLGEIADQLDLLVGKRAHLTSKNADGAYQFIVLQHGYVQLTSNSAELGRGDAKRIAIQVSRFGKNIIDLNCFFRAATHEPSPVSAPARIGARFRNSA